MDIKDKKVLILKWVEHARRTTKRRRRRRRTLGSISGFQELPWSASNDCPLSPFAPPTLFTSANTPLTPPNPKFYGNSFNRPITRSSSQPLTPSFHPLASRPNCCPLSKHFPSSLSFSRSPRPTAVNAPRTVVLSVIHLSSKPTRLSPTQSSQTLSLSLSFSLSPPLSLWLSLPLSPGSKIFTAAAVVRSHGHKTLWANRGAVNVWSRWCTFHLRSDTGPIDPDVVKTETAYWASPHASTNQTLTKHTQAQH